jgi:hypothetical protein
MNQKKENIGMEIVGDILSSTDGPAQVIPRLHGLHSGGHPQSAEGYVAVSFLISQRSTHARLRATTKGIFLSRNV